MLKRHKTKQLKLSLSKIKTITIKHRYIKGKKITCRKRQQTVKDPKIRTTALKN